MGWVPPPPPLTAARLGSRPGRAGAGAQGRDASPTTMSHFGLCGLASAGYRPALPLNLQPSSSGSDSEREEEGGGVLWGQKGADRGGLGAQMVPDRWTCSRAGLPSLLPFPRDDGWALGTAGQGTGASGWVCGAECLDDVAISNNQLILCSDVCQWHGQGVASNQTRAPDSGFVLLTSYEKCFCAWLEFFKRIQKSH